MKRSALCLIVLALIFALCGCGRTGDDAILPTADAAGEDITPPTADTASKAFVLPTAGTAGGYQILSSSIEITVYATGDRKFVALATPDGARLQCYCDQNETLFVHTWMHETTYHREPVTVEQEYPNPLQYLLEGLKPLPFSLTDPETNLYRADVRTENMVAKDVAYIEYFITMDWLDGKTYHFQYFVDDYGATLVSVEAPDAINPAFTANTPWQIDVENCAVINRTTGESVDMVITHTENHIGPPLTGGQTEIVVNEYSVELTFGEDGIVQTVRYIYPKAELTLDILNAFTIPDPALPPDAREMTPGEAEDAMFRILAAESII